MFPDGPAQGLVLKKLGVPKPRLKLGFLKIGFYFTGFSDQVKPRFSLGLRFASPVVIPAFPVSNGWKRRSGYPDEDDKTMENNWFYVNPQTPFFTG